MKMDIINEINETKIEILDSENNENIEKILLYKINNLQEAIIEKRP